MSAAARAAKEGKSQILLERTPHLTDTIFKYQKHKHVMATPEFLPLRSDLGFKESRARRSSRPGTTGLDTRRPMSASTSK